jgi:hypothetical protein
MDSEPGYLRIATEEAFVPPELITLWRSMLEDGTCDDPGFLSLPGFCLRNTAERPAAILARLQDLGERRIADMDAAGIDRQIIWVPAIMFCRDVLGPDRVMYAMEYPYEYTPEEVTIQDALPVDAAAKKAFFHGIAEQVFSPA